MPHDPARAAETQGWLARGASDLRAAEHEFRATPPLLDDIVFHCQQAAEKVLKGFLTWHDRPFRKTHSLEELGEQCLEMDPTLRALIDRAVPLTEYAWKFRYPGEPEEPSRQEAEEALAIARDLDQAVVSRLPREVRR
ncbi:MAG: HEPN domain-containing protein [Gemmatimonadota bacterium]